MSEVKPSLPPERLLEMVRKSGLTIGHTKEWHRLRYTGSDPRVDATGCRLLELPVDDESFNRQDDMRHHRRILGIEGASSSQYMEGPYSTWSMASNMLAPGLRVATHRLWSLFATTVVGHE